MPDKDSIWLDLLAKWDFWKVFISKMSEAPTAKTENGAPGGMVKRGFEMWYESPFLAIHEISIA